MSIIDYQTEHLFLLIGKNPLPNYVAAKLLANERTTVHLIHSSDTLVYAQRLENKLKGACQFAEKICVQPSEANKIKGKITERLGGINRSVGLNYTGGTKAMAVHIYRAVADKAPNAKFSYLDPRSLAVLIDPPEGVEDERRFYLGKPNGSTEEQENFKKTKISLDELLYLHKLILFQDVRPKPRGIKIVEAIQSEAIEKDSWWDFQKALRRCLDDAQKASNYNAFNEANKGEMEKQLRKQQIEFPSDLSNLKKAFAENFPCQNVISTNQLALANLPNDVDAIEFVNFLLGTWLEDFTLSRMIEIKDGNGKAVQEKCYLESCGSSLEVALPQKKATDPKRRFFELDVVAMRGYRLFAISCSQESSIFKVKRKLFEAVHRAKQIAGDEARIGLVCLAKSSNINKIKSQLEEDHIEVFGREDLANLDEKLEKWFNREG
jgi:hypothetical protein